MKKLVLFVLGVMSMYQTVMATTCPSAEVIPASPTLPYTTSLVCGGSDDITSSNVTNVCGSTFYYGGNESVYTWTPSASYTGVTIDYNGVSWSGIMLYAGCPTSGGTCVAQVQSSSTTKTLTVGNITAGTTYYIVFDTWPSPNDPCGGIATFTLNGNIVAPAAPPTPTQDPATPTCASGSTIDLSGTPPTGVTWYWETTATGTSMANPYSGPYTIYANGTYYARSYDSGTSQWSVSSSSITVTNFPVASATAPTPVADQNPTCVTTGTNLTVPTAPSGVEYYWQDVVQNGSSMTTPATSPYFVNASGTYYVAAYETATQCWSPTAGVTITANSLIPPPPTADTSEFFFCTSANPINITADPAYSAGPTCNVTASASGTDNSNVTATVTNFACNPGTLISATMDASIGPNCITGGGSWYYYDIVVNGTVVASQQCNQTGFDLTPYMPLTSVSIVSYDDPSDGFGDFVTMNLTVNCVYQGTAYGVNWFDAATGGNALGTGTQLNALGTSVLPTGAPGSYQFYAESDASGCPSNSRVLVTATLSDVNVAVVPVDVSCNGLNNGSFTATPECGTAPFTYSVNGGAFGAIPTDLTAGTYTIVAQDATAANSPTYTIIINEPTAPAGLTVTNTSFFTATVDWTPQGDETDWVIEYGPAGFTLGTGTQVTASAHPYTITGLTENTSYDFYVRANCVATSAFAGPVNFSTDVPFTAWDNQCGPGFTDISGTGTALNLTDDATTVITLTNPISFQGSSSTSVTVSNNGWLSFGSVTLDPFNTDLDDEYGNVWWTETTLNGDNYFIAQWNRPHFSTVTGQDVNFEVAVNQTTNEIYYLYSDVVFGGSQSYYDYAGGSQIDASGPQSTVTISSYDPTYLQNNSCVHFYTSMCPNITSVSGMLYPDEADLNWSAGLYGETEWTVVYGPQGFDPAAVPSQAYGTFTQTSPDIQLTGLTQLTTYDVYIYSECTADNLESNGYFYEFTTLPWCADPTNVVVGTDIDSLELTWNYTANTGYDPTSYAVQYGWTGFGVGSGTMATANGVNPADTIYDAALMGGGVYDVYVQATCGTDTSNWVGPVTVVMPLTNDLACSPDTLMVGQMGYVFNNTGATVTTGEDAIAPPATGAQTTTGWTNSTLNKTTWFMFQAPSTGSVRINCTAIEYNNQIGVYTAADCSVFSTYQLLAANDNEIGGSSVASNFTVCGLTPGQYYYVMSDAFNNTTGNYAIAVTEIVLNAGSANPVTNVCSGTPVDLSTTIAGNDMGGMWMSSIPAVNASITGSTLTTTGLAYTTYDLEYRVTDGCAYDSILSQVHVYGPSQAGTDGTVTVCKHQSVNLYTGLNGTADIGGTWYDPSNAPITGSQITASGFAGSYNYDYIVNNGVCPNDTSNVVIVVLSTCDALGLDEAAFAGVNVYPNPSSGLVNISSDVAESFDLKVTDVNGRLISEVKAGVTNAAIAQVDLSKVERGVYLIHLSNTTAEKTFRVVIQ